MVVLSENAESFQVLQGLVQWGGFTTGMITGPILANSTLVVCLAAVGTVVKGWNDFKKYSFKVDMSRFAFTTYAKALIELRTYVRGIPFEGLEGFLIKMQTLDDTIIDFTPPLPKRCVQEYYRHFVYQQVDAQCYVDGCHRPLMSKSYWMEKDEKVNPHSPTLSARHHGVQKKTKKKKNHSATTTSKRKRRRSRRYFSPLGFGQYKEKSKGSGWWQNFKRNTRQDYKETRDIIKQNKALQRLLNR